MTGFTDFWHIKGNKWIAKIDKKLAKKLYTKLKEIEKLKPEMDHNFNKGTTKKLHEEIETFIADLLTEDTSLGTIHKDSQKQMYDVMSEIKEMIQRLSNINLSAPDSAADLIQLEKTEILKIKEELMVKIRRTRSETADIQYDREHKLKYVNLTGVMHVVQVIYRLEKHLKKELKPIKHDEELVNHDIKELEKGHKIEQKDLQDHLKELHFDVNRMANDICEIDHDDVILEFNLISELEYLRKILIELKECNYPDEAALIPEYQHLEHEMQEGFKHLKNMATYLYERSEKSN